MSPATPAGPSGRTGTTTVRLGAEAAFQRAIAAFRSGDLGQVRELCSALLAQGVGTPAIPHLLGVALCEAGDAAGALRALRVSLQRDPGGTEALYDLAALAGRTEGISRTWLARARRLAPAAEAAHAARLLASDLRQAERLRRAGDLHAADRLLRGVLHRAPDSGDALRELAEIAFTRGNEKLADHLARAAIQAAPATIGNHRLHGLLAWSRGDLAAAGRSLRNLLRISPAEAQALYGLGLIAKAQERPAAAGPALRRAHRLGWPAAAAPLHDLARPATPRRLEGRRIAFYHVEPFHQAILAPIEQAAGDRHRLLATADATELRRFRPEVVVLADLPQADLRRMAPEALFVYTRHGLAEKGFGYYAAGAYDRVCVSSPFVGERCRRIGRFPEEMIWVTGYSQLDPLFAGTAGRPAMPLASGRPVLLFAPTWNATLSAAPMLGAGLIERLRGAVGPDLQIVIKPHPHCFRRQPQWIEWWRAAARQPGVHLVDDPAADVVPLLAAADLLVSDVSGVVFEFLPRDRPVILMSNPDRSRDGRWYDPEAIEWQWRDLGTELTDAADLPQAVAAALADPGAQAAARARYRDLLFGSLTDGRAGERIVAAIEALPHG